MRPLRRPTLAPWARAAAVMFAVGWGANQFSSLLLAYRLQRGVSETTADALFGIYALGLIPALLLIGPISDRRGRRPFVATAGALSFIASAALVLGDHSLGLLYLGRFLAGICSGAAFAAGTAWVKELSVAPFDPGAGEQAGARRAAIALSAGFGLGPLVAGLLAQWAPDPLLSAYLPHLLVAPIALALLLGTPETVPPDRPAPGALPAATGRIRLPGAGHPRFRGVVAPAAPWVFGAASISFAVLPGLVTQTTQGFRVGFAAVVAGVTLALGVLIQPLARRLDRDDDARGTLAGLSAIVAGTLLGAVAAMTGQWPFVIGAAVLLGGGYGLCLVSGLLEIQRLAAADDLAALTAIFYALTYIGFAAPIALAELERAAAASTLLLATGALCGLVTLRVRAADARHPSPPPAPAAGPRRERVTSS